MKNNNRNLVFKTINSKQFYLNVANVYAALQPNSFTDYHEKIFECN